MKGILFVVGTPIGNLQDMSARAIHTLSECDLIACEDTRVTKKILSAYGISVPMESYHAQSGTRKEEKIIAALAKGKKVALVSDAGTPAISDPGSLLVARVRERLPDVVVTPIPGPSAAIAALSASGVPASEFVFLGFLPHKKGREKLFAEIAVSRRTVVFYESPHRIMKTLHALSEHLSDENGRRMVVVARELTKIYEEFVRGSAREVAGHFEAHPDTVRGEFTVIVAGY